MTRRLRGWVTLLALLLLCATASADERILDYHSEIVVGADAGMQVTETIRVRSENLRIVHGLYRDFPTDYRDRGGNRVRVGFEVVGLTRDGAAEPFHTRAQDNGVRVYFGSEDTRLAPGEHTYALTYRTTRQLGFFDDHDELYWNVTGNGWEFAIDAASAAVTLPGAVPPADLRLDAYTGGQGVQGRAWRAEADRPSHAVFATTAPLAPQEGLTIALGFPKGVVSAPTARQRALWFLGNNAGVLALLTGLLLLLAWYLVQWSKVGRDPPAGTIIPLYDPPAGHTPGALRYVERMGWDNRCAAADLVEAAVRGAIRISHADDSFSIERTGEPELAPSTARLVRELLAGARRFTFERSAHARISRALKAHRSALKATYAGSHFRKNTSIVVIGALITLAAAIGGALLVGGLERTVGTTFMLVWLTGWSVAVFALCAGAIGAWREVGRQPSHKRALAIGGAIFMSLFAVPFVIGELAGFGALVMLSGVGFAIAVLALIATNLLFAWLMKAPTQAGRKLLDQIEGLRLYLGVAERDDLARAREPAMNAEQFQRFLPYALALQVEDTWTNRFAAAVGPAAAAAAASSMGWYHGSDIGRSAGLGNFASAIGTSFNSAIASSSSAPGSSSGGGGGGSSGGGGGGGGGGGW